MATKPDNKAPKFKARIRGLQLMPDDQRYLAALSRKYPERNYTALIRQAIRELAQREQVA